MFIFSTLQELTKEAGDRSVITTALPNQESTWWSQVQEFHPRGIVEGGMCQTDWQDP